MAAAQAGVLSAAQIRSAGFPLRSADRLVAQRHWNRLASGIYWLQAGRPPWLSQAWAGVLLGGDFGRLGFEAAGHLWKLVDDPPRTVTVLVPLGRQPTSRSPWVFRRETCSTRDQRSPGSPPRTTIEDTVIDLCQGATTSQVLDLVTKAVQGRRTSAPPVCSHGSIDALA